MWVFCFWMCWPEYVTQLSLDSKFCAVQTEFETGTDKLKILEIETQTKKRILLLYSYSHTTRETWNCIISQLDTWHIQLFMYDTFSKSVLNVNYNTTLWSYTVRAICFGVIIEHSWIPSPLVTVATAENLFVLHTQNLESFSKRGRKNHFYSAFFNLLAEIMTFSDRFY